MQTRCIPAKLSLATSLRFAAAQSRPRRARVDLFNCLHQQSDRFLQKIKFFKSTKDSVFFHRYLLLQQRLLKFFVLYLVRAHFRQQGSRFLFHTLKLSVPRVSTCGHITQYFQAFRNRIAANVYNRYRCHPCGVTLALVQARTRTSPPLVRPSPPTRFPPASHFPSSPFLPSSFSTTSQTFTHESVRYGCILGHKTYLHNIYN